MYIEPTRILINLFIGIWLFLPAMVPNSIAATFKGSIKIDFGKSYNGKRIFGDGKSWKGFFSGVLSGIGTGLLTIKIASIWNLHSYLQDGSSYSDIKIVILLSIGAMLGDLCGAFIKRRFGMERGHRVPILDQYDFVVGALFLTALFDPGWVYNNYIEGQHLLSFILMLLMIFFVHRFFNVVGYKVGIKKEPW